MVKAKDIAAAVARPHHDRNDSGAFGWQPEPLACSPQAICYNSCRDSGSFVPVTAVWSRSTRVIRFGQDDSKAVNAAATVFREHGAFIRTIIRFQAGSEFQEDELAQQLFLSLVNAPIPEDVENVRSYLYQAIANDVIDLGRRKARQRKHFRKFAEEFRISIHKQAPADALMGEEESNAAFACLTRQLSSREAEAVKLRYQDDRSIPEIARIMGVDRRTVSRYLTAALKQLRRILAIE